MCGGHSGAGCAGRDGQTDEKNTGAGRGSPPQLSMGVFKPRLAPGTLDTTPPSHEVHSPRWGGVGAGDEALLVLGVEGRLDLFHLNAVPWPPLA